MKLKKIKRYINLFPMEGQDYSEVKQKKWNEKLKDNNEGYFSEHIINSAEEFYKNEKIAHQREFDSFEEI